MSRRSLVLRLGVVAAFGEQAPVSATTQERSEVRRAIHEQTIERARDGAARKIEQPACRRLLDEFKSGSARTRRRAGRSRSG
jgi:hypothetical protein